MSGKLHVKEQCHEDFAVFFWSILAKIITMML